MTDFQRDTSFERRARRRGSDRRTLGALLGDRRPEGSRAAAAADFFARQEPSGRIDPEPAAASEPPAPPSEEATTATPATALVDQCLSFADGELASLLAAVAATAQADARASAQAAIQERLAHAVATVRDALRDEVEARGRQRCHDAALIGELVRTIAAHVLPVAIRAAPLDDVLAELPALLARLEGPDHVTIAVHPTLEADLAGRLPGLGPAAGFSGEITVEADEALEPGDAIVRWPDGRAARSLEARLDEATTLCTGWLAERRWRDAAVPVPTESTTEARHEQ